VYVCLSVTQVVDLSTGSRRDDVTASIGKMCVSKSGRFVVVDDYDRQRGVAVHCLDGLLRQLEREDIAARAKQRCPGYVEVQRQTTASRTNVVNGHADVCGVRPSQPESEMTIEEFDRRCKRPPPPPVFTKCHVINFSIVIIRL